MSQPTDNGGVAVVSGAAGALGSAIVAELLARGMTVVAVDRRIDGNAEPGLTWHEVDVSDPTGVDALLKRVVDDHGRLDVVVHTVGTFRPGAAVDAAEEDWQLLLDVNLTGAWWVSRAAARVMKDAGRGSIVHIGARNGVEPTPGAAAYGVTKGALIHLVRVLDSELRKAGVRVNAVVPGVIDTPANRAVLSEQTMARAVSPAAIAKVIAFLVGDDAEPVSGAVIPVYGAG